MNENARAFAGRGSRDESGALVWQGALADASIRIRIEERECRDSMSDETPPTPYMGVLTLPEGNEGPGCCQTLVR
ncbi:MAG: hypothetical protein HC882_05335 [Acidobacteria bacterium]|nr:hypothetical protein [Acidobacteriota bacterium]